jgi:hypothetical protein
MKRRQHHKHNVARRYSKRWVQRSNGYGITVGNKLFLGDFTIRTKFWKTYFERENLDFIN